MVWRGLKGSGGNAAIATLVLVASIALPVAAAARGQTGGKQQERAAKPLVSPAAEAAIHQIYAGDPAAGITAARAIETRERDQPLGYLVEAEARWWQLYCRNSEIRYGMVDVWQLNHGPEERAYRDAARKAVELAEAQLAKKQTAEAELWAGMGYAFEARLDGLLGKKLDTARSGVQARTHLLKALELDPQLADADTGLGLYNYYVDTLSPIVKLLRFFLGIPGGSKKEGMRQLRTAMEHGQITGVEARFYLAKNLRTYDHDYAEALRVAEPLVREFPRNPIFLLLVANLEIELGRREQAEETLSRIAKLKIADEACAARAEQMGKQLLAPQP
jgi:tetratricopeptide (TPR) repeat protein